MSGILAGKIAVVTGGARGIGLATAQKLTREGATVAICDLNGPEEALNGLKDLNPNSFGMDCDATDFQAVKHFFGAVVAKLGPIDILVNNVGSLVQRKPFAELEEELWHTVLRVNLDSMFYCCKMAVPAMVERKRGAIVNLASIAGRNGAGPGAVPYGCAKAGVIGFTQTLAKEMAPHGVRVNAVSPGTVDTNFHKQFNTPEGFQRVVSGIPLGRAAQPEDVAKVIAFLASDEAGYLVGETIEVNGGQIML